MRRSLLVGVTPFLARAALALLVVSAMPAPGSAQSEGVVVYLVRHAERAEDGTSDPPISRAGEERSEQVAALLRDAGITHIHTTTMGHAWETSLSSWLSIGVPHAMFHASCASCSLHVSMLDRDASYAMRIIMQCMALIP